MNEGKKIQELVFLMSEDKTQQATALAMVKQGDEMTLSVAGKKVNLSILLADAILKKPELVEIFEAAIILADTLGDTCDCEGCKARRAGNE